MKNSDTIILKAFLFTITECEEALPLSLKFGIHQVIKDWDNGNSKALVALEELLYNYDEILPLYQQACVTLQQNKVKPEIQEEVEEVEEEKETASPPLPLPNLKTVGFMILRAEDPQGVAKRKLEEYQASPEWYLQLTLDDFSNEL
ncbi:MULTISPECIES: hypothetical protein [unclassified Roseofilum]|uniref:hypothetical protein n=1 Tax=unclassified Roseofilum TaxID=2620099 RepID=UPI000E810ABA|nr:MULTISPECIES: hypothetical protein [unclassified Roseofilum]MBP0010619.1 hypothetical protein [Roseofilum sp. Belize Diploria]MBP0035764.1 hypothetical protein [Roseofilum sp. Belize BBD 4]HBQ97880.1 hypothetical protein [Cyanobacteria bacterium UBA11691]